MQNFHPESLERACRLEYAFSHIIIEMTHLLGQTQPDRDVLSGRKITSSQVGAITEAPRGTQDPASGSRMYTVAIVECAIDGPAGALHKRLPRHQRPASEFLLDICEQQG